MLTRKYVLLIALLVVDWSGRWKAIETLNLGDLEWGAVLAVLARSEEVPTYVENVDLKRRRLML